MSKMEPPLPIRDRLRELNNKAFYLLMALSVIYRRGQHDWLFKTAFAATIMLAVFPVQECIRTEDALRAVRHAKAFILTAALLLTLGWVVWGSPATMP